MGERSPLGGGEGVEVVWGGEGLVEEGVERLSREAARIRRALLPRTESTSPPPLSLLSPAPKPPCLNVVQDSHNLVHLFHVNVERSTQIRDLF